MRIREKKPERRKSVTERLEDRARAIHERLKEDRRPTPLSVLEQDIGFVSEQLDRLRMIQKEQLDDLREQEFHFQKLLQRTNKYDADRRHRIEVILSRLARERRDRIGEHQERVAGLHDKLSTLFSQRSFLVDDENNRRPYGQA
jgi:hypothetical protein